MYAEIRTTPREYTVGEHLSEKESIDVILETIKRMEEKLNHRIIIRLLLSINRSESKYFLILLYNIETKLCEQLNLLSIFFIPTKLT